ncbi:DUF4426 domain-containing protein [Bacterioplanoides pacificum]|uniref:DUF4426 domain-containing protein n=1 Tax=Bacterioplanoides pacificum TaxID=1171596 RepID=A0ABV7VR04_9GAMM
MKVLMTIALTLLSALSLARDNGEQKQVFGDYEVHYIGLNSTFLTPEVAKAYDITRSGSLGYLSVSILKKAAKGELAKPVSGRVEGQLRNLIGQAKTLQFKQVKESNAVYYITTFRFDDEDMYNLNLKVTPDGQKRTFDVKFSQRFYQE